MKYVTGYYMMILMWASDWKQKRKWFLFKMILIWKGLSSMLYMFSWNILNLNAITESKSCLCWSFQTYEILSCATSANIKIFSSSLTFRESHSSLWCFFRLLSSPLFLTSAWNYSGSILSPLGHLCLLVKDSVLCCAEQKHSENRANTQQHLAGV